MKFPQPASVGQARRHLDLHASSRPRCPRCLVRGCAGRRAETAAGAVDPLLMTLVLTLGTAARPQHKDEGHAISKR